MVGAPHGTFPGGLNLPLSDGASQDNVSQAAGLVYECPLAPGACGPVGRNSLLQDSVGLRLFDDQRKWVPVIYGNKRPYGILYGGKSGQCMLAVEHLNNGHFGDYINS